MVGGYLLIELRRRKNMASGAFLNRPCCCDGHDSPIDDFHVPQLLFPACPVRPVVRERVVVEKLISPSFRPPNLIRHPSSRGASPNWAAADKLATHSLRRGAVRSGMPAGGTFDQLLRASQRRGNATRPLFGLREGGRRAIMGFFPRLSWRGGKKS